MKKSTKNIIIGATVGGLVCSVLAPGIAVTVVKNLNHKLKDETGNFNFNGQTFNSKNELINYAMQNAEIYSSNVDMPAQWSLRINGKEEFFNSPLEVENFLEKNIQEVSVASSTEINESPIGEIYPSELGKISSSNAKTKTVYRGKNNSIHTTVEKAKDSYLEMHDAYVFRNIFFRTKEELASYLRKNYEQLKGQATLNSIILKTPTGFKSNPIEIDKIISSDPTVSEPALKYVEKFVKQNAESYFSLDVDMGKPITDKKYYKDLSSSVADNNFDATYTTINSNQGKGNYIIDTESTDEATLYGPYYVKSSDSILGMKDPKNWRKIKGNDQPFFEDTKNLTAISDFFNLILADSSTEENGQIFNTNSTLNPEIEEYFKMLEKDQRKVYNSVINLFRTIKRGKRYGEFYKLPILFNYTIDQMIYRSSPQKYIDATRDIYTKICGFYDEQLRAFIPEKMLWDAKQEKQFTFAEIFRTKDISLDLNYDIKALSDEIVREYKDLFTAIKFISVAYANLNQSSNIIFLNGKEKIDLDWLQQYTGVNLNNKFEKEYIALFNLLKCDNPLEFLMTYTRLIPNSIKIKSTFAVTNFVMNYAKNEVLKRVMSFYVDPQAAIQKNEYTEQHIKILKTFKFLSFSANDGKYHGLNKIAEQNHNFIREYFKKNERNINTSTFMKLAMLLNINPNFKIPKSWMNSQYKDIEKEVDQRLKKFELGFLGKIGFVSKQIDEVLNCVNTNNFIHFAVVFEPKLLDKFENSLAMDIEDKISQVWKSLNSMLDKCGKIMVKALDALAGFAYKIKDIVQVSATIFKKVPKLGKALAIINTAIKILINIHKTDYFSYVFETSDVKYVWDGGVEESWIFGIIKGTVSNANSMQLLEPTQVIRPNISSGYYYNGKTFPNLDVLKRVQINDILNGRYESPKIKTVYAFEKADAKNQFKKYVSENLNDLTNMVIDDIKKYAADPNNIINRPSFVTQQFKYTFANGVTFDPSKDQAKNIQAVLDSIRPTKIATLPILNNNPDNTSETNASLNAIQSEAKNKIPVYRDDGLEDNSLPNYVLPGQSWNPQQGIIQNQTNNNYVIIDPNSSENESLSDTSIKNKLKNNFYNYFDVESKIVLEDDLINHNLFSELSTNIERKSIYWVKGKFNQSKIFSSKYAAMKWLLDSYDFKVYYEASKFETYIYDGKRFDDMNDFIRWVVGTARGEINEK